MMYERNSPADLPGQPAVSNDLRPRASGRKSTPGTNPTALRLSSSTLFRGTDEVLIEHLGREYRLRLTRNGKLILTA